MKPPDSRGSVTLSLSRTLRISERIRVQVIGSTLRALPTETKVDSGTSQSKSGSPVDLSNSGIRVQVIGTTLKLSEQLTLMISGLRDISPAAALAMEKAIKSDADQVRPYRKRVSI